MTKKTTSTPSYPGTRFRCAQRKCALICPGVTQNHRASRQYRGIRSAQQSPRVERLAPTELLPHLSLARALSLSPTPVALDVATKTQPLAEGVRGSAQESALVCPGAPRKHRTSRQHRGRRGAWLVSRAKRRFLTSFEKKQRKKTREYVRLSPPRFIR